jgi:peptidoglycan/xylan/chitin deacetylase (PgdA/CDA1 family)
VLRQLLTSPGHRVLRAPLVGRAAVAAAAIRRRGLVMVFHRVVRDAATSGGVVPTVSWVTFRQQIETLRELGDVVPLISLLEAPPAGRRPRFALTFDDDSITHHDVVLPILRELNLAGTFFLCGRSLHGLGPPWFQILDTLVLRSGITSVARQLGVAAPNAMALSEACTADPGLQRRLEEELHRDDLAVPDQLDRRHIESLARAGMTIGFHTLRHRALTGLSEGDVLAALVEGREALEAVIAEPIRLFAYPHGVADVRVAACVRRAGYLGAWTGRPRAIQRGNDPYRLGRWEPGPLSDRNFAARVAVNLNGWNAG